MNHPLAVESDEAQRDRTTSDRSRRHPRVPASLAVTGVLVGLAIGLFAGPTMPWVDQAPETDSAEAGFARDMVVHHDQAVRMSLAALNRSSDPEVRQLALDVVLTQRGETGAMQSWLDDWGLQLFTGDAERMSWMRPSQGHELLPDGRMPGMATSAEVARLETLAPAELDTSYLTLLYLHHAGGIPMAEEILELSDRPTVRALATSIRDSQTSELGALADLLRKKGAPVPAATAHGGGHSG